MRMIVGLAAGGNLMQAQERTILAHRMVVYRNIRDLQTCALQADKSLSCFVLHRNFQALNALILPNIGMQIQVNTDHAPLSGQAIAEAFKVRI